MRASLLGSLLVTAASTPVARAVSGFTSVFNPDCWASEANDGGSAYSPTSCCNEWRFDLTIYAYFSIGSTTEYLNAKSFPDVETEGVENTVTTATASWNNTSILDYFVSLDARFTWEVPEQAGKTATTEISTLETAYPNHSSLVAILSSGAPNAVISPEDPIRILTQWSLGFKVMVPITAASNPNPSVGLSIREFNGVAAPAPPASGGGVRPVRLLAAPARTLPAAGKGCATPQPSPARPLSLPLPRPTAPGQGPRPHPAELRVRRHVLPPPPGRSRQQTARRHGHQGGRQLRDDGHSVKRFYEPPQPMTTGRFAAGGAVFSPYRHGNSLPRFVLPTPHSRGELTTQLAVACLGAGVITSLAVAQGQNPLTALGITLFSAVAAVAVGQVL